MATAAEVVNSSTREQFSSRPLFFNKPVVSFRDTLLSQVHRIQQSRFEKRKHTTQLWIQAERAMLEDKPLPPEIEKILRRREHWQKIAPYKPETPLIGLEKLRASSRS